MLGTGDGPLDSNPQSCWTCHEAVGRGWFLTGVVRLQYTKTDCEPQWITLEVAKKKFIWESESVFLLMVWFGLMVFNATFNNISAISWRSVLLREETGVPGENHRSRDGSRGGGARAPKIGKNMIFWRKIVIFHTKYDKYFRASLRSAQFF